MKIVVTGTSGFLGSAVAHTISQTNEWDFLFTSRDISGTSDTLQIKLFSPELIREYRPDVILHTAAMAAAGKCEQDPEEAWGANVTLTKRLALLAQELNAHFIYVSTDLVFDGYQSIPENGLNESLPPMPLSIYAKTKLAGEYAASLFCSRVSIVRTSLLYGPSYGTKGGVLGWMLEAVKRGEKITLFSDEWRTPIFVNDAVDVLLIIAKKSLLGTWHLGGNSRFSREEFGRAVLTEYGYSDSLINAVHRDDVKSVPPRPEDVSLDSSAIIQETSIKLHTLKEALRRSRSHAR